MKFEFMNPIAKGNPFLEDLYHMGIGIGTNCVIMYEKHPHLYQDYIIVCNTETGERVKVTLGES